jgi:hypothetical protein
VRVERLGVLSELDEAIIADHLDQKFVDACDDLVHRDLVVGFGSPDYTVREETNLLLEGPHHHDKCFWL